MNIISLLSLFLGYMIGSLSPSYFLGKLIKSIDIREHGDGNAGGSNVYHVVGLKAAVIVVIFDLSKGLISMYIASRLGVGDLFVHIAGLAAVAGHVFPFYLSFRGGKGIGTSLGILFYYFYTMIRNTWLTLYLLLFLIFILFVVHFVTRKKEILGLIALPSLLVIVLISSPFNLITVFSGIYIIYIFVVNIVLNILSLWKRNAAELS